MGMFHDLTSFMVQLWGISALGRENWSDLNSDFYNIICFQSDGFKELFKHEEWH